MRNPLRVQAGLEIVSIFDSSIKKFEMKFPSIAPTDKTSGDSLNEKNGAWLLSKAAFRQFYNSDLKLQTHTL